MSGPVDTAVTPPAEPPPHPSVEVTDSRDSQVGTARVRRALPQRRRRTIGAWCLVDHLGPLAVDGTGGLDIGPHPHTGLATVTWLVEGELLHTDSLGSEQPIAPGQLNLMHAGEGVSHAEEQRSRHGRLHGVQLWVAQPESTRHTAAAFGHHTDLPRVEVAGGGTATVLLGDLAGTASPARTDTPLLGAELTLAPGSTTWPLEASYEHGLVVLSGAVGVDDRVVVPGQLAHLGLGRAELALTALEPTRLLLLGGEPFEAPLVMWWNYVGRTREEMVAAHEQWQADDGRFGTVGSRLPRIHSPEPLWRTAPRQSG